MFFDGVELTEVIVLKKMNVSKILLILKFKNKQEIYILVFIGNFPIDFVCIFGNEIYFQCAESF